MKRKLLVALILATCFVGKAMGQRPVSAQKIGNRIDVSVADRFFTSYVFQNDEKYPFFFPVNGPISGGSVTSMRNGIYPHHSSLFFGCDRVNGGNYWQEGLERGRIVSIGARILDQSNDKVTIEDECIWKRPDAPSPIKDRRIITVSSPNDSLYLIDFEIEMEMLMDVTIEKTNHSLFSARIAEDLTVKQGGVMVDREGRRGEKKTFGQPSPWIDFYGQRKTGVEGIAIMQHPSSKWYPSRWFTRDYGFMSPTPMWWPENGTDIKLQKGEKIFLKYRVVIHGGTTEEASIEKLFNDFSK